MHIYIVNGAPGSGKTTFEKIVQELYGEEDVWILSTVDRVKAAAEVLGWDGTKTPENRKFLSDLKDLWTEWRDGPFLYVQDNLEKIKRWYQIWDVSHNMAIVFIDSREPWEIERFAKELNAQTILIKRPSGADDERILNHADRDVEQYKYDYVIDNSSDLENLKNECELFLDFEQLKKTQ